MTTDFSATASSLGYLYQVRYALFLLLNHPEETELSIEKLDDVAFEESGNPTERLQLKHHLKRQASLTDSSEDLWKTLRVWSTEYAEHKLDLPGVVLTLITTATVPDDSIAALLRPGRDRNHVLAATKLTEIAQSSKNQALTKAHDAFLKLQQNEREILTNAIQVLDSSPTILSVTPHIKQKLEFSVHKQYRDQMHERLEGWWFAKVVDHLANNSAKIISRFEVQNKIIELAQGFREDNLPIDFLDDEPITPPDPEQDRRIFVFQLRAIALNSRRIEKAMRDYYRAFEQRSKWARDELLIDEELEKYERKLVDEWERYSLSLQQRLINDSSTEAEMQDCGRQVYDWIEIMADFPIRPRVTESYVMRGSYHLLADQLVERGGKRQPNVWWHPQFLDRLEAILLTPQA